MSRTLLQLVVRHAESLVADRESDGDGDLLARFARERDESAFAELLRRHGPLVWAVCRHSLPDNADAEDAFQATFLALIRAPESVRSGNALPGWLHGTAVRVVGKLKRSAVRRKRREERVAGGEADHTVPEGRWEALLAAVHEEVQRLPDAMRTAFVLCELEGVRQPDAAARLGWNAGTLTSRLTRARQRLIERLTQRGLAPALIGSLTLGVASAHAAPPQELIESVVQLLSAGAAAPPAILELIHTVNPMSRMKLAAATLLVACGFGTAFFPASRAESPPVVEAVVRPVETVTLADDPAAKMPAGLRYVPADAAFFAHVDVANLWTSKLGQSIREADKEMFEQIVRKARRAYGAEPADLRSATVFLPSLKDGEPRFGLVLEFREAYDKAALQAGLDADVPKPMFAKVVAASPTVAVLLVNLDEAKYGKPIENPGRGPLTAALADAAAGKHLIAVGSNFGALPEAIRMAMVPQAFRPLLQAEALSAFISLDKELKLDVRVKGADAGEAKAAAAALGDFAKMIHEELGKSLTKIDDDPSYAPAKPVFEAIRTALKEAKPGAEGDTARITATMPADLPYAQAFLVSMGKVRGAAGRSQSSNNLKQIAIALHNYADVNGAFPPAAVCDKKGKPMLSWRVLILPYIEQDALYKKFKLDEPWDSPNNKPLSEIAVKVFSDPNSKTAKANETHYRAFVGNGAAFDWIKGRKITDFQDGTSNTILVATAKDPVIWSKPDELEFDPEKSDMTKMLGFYSGDTALAMFADGSVRAFPKTITKKSLHALITASGGEMPGKE
ncbi:MAG: sigma-70 family RNA polymerase sigma factor [Gemmataceae bacterium]